MVKLAVGIGAVAQIRLGAMPEGTGRQAMEPTLSEVHPHEGFRAEITFLDAVRIISKAGRGLSWESF